MLRNIPPVSFGTQITLAALGFLVCLGVAASEIKQQSPFALLASTATSYVTSTTTTTAYVSGQFTAQAGPCDSNTIRLDWASGPSGVTFVLKRNDTPIYQGAGLTFSDTGLVPDTSYNYTLQGVSSSTVVGTANASAHAPPRCVVSSTSSTTNNFGPSQTTTTTTTTTFNSGPSQTSTTTATNTTSPTTSGVTTTTQSPTQTQVPGTVQNTTQTAPVQTVNSSNTGTKSQPAITERPFEIAAPATTQSSVTDETTQRNVAALQLVTTTFLQTTLLIEQTKTQLLGIVNESITKAENGASQARTQELEDIRTRLTKVISDTFLDAHSITPTALTQVRNDVQKALSSLQSTTTTSTSLAFLTAAEKSLTTQIAGQKLDLLYRDSNRDGISDYEATYVYNMDPKKPSPVSTYRGKTLTAQEKILLGFDPSQATLVQVFPDDANHSTIPATPLYTVTDISLTATTSRVAFSGEALPNSFITLYIFSTPIVVTVKSDATGKWEYTLDSELDNGQHTIQVATVDNTGKILARSDRFAFTKTANAATLDSIPSAPLLTGATKPSFFEMNRVILLSAAFAGMFIFVLILMGLGIRKYGTTGTTSDTPTPPTT